MKELFLKYIFLGDNSEEGTPVPIPNTEVKLFSADDSVGKNRTSPSIFLCFFQLLVSCFFMLSYFKLIIELFLSFTNYLFFSIISARKEELG